MHNLHSENIRFNVMNHTILAWSEDPNEKFILLEFYSSTIVTFRNLILGIKYLEIENVLLFFFLTEISFATFLGILHGFLWDKTLKKALRKIEMNLLILTLVNFK